MAELKKEFKTLGFENVITYLNSGNVIFTSDIQDENTITNTIHKKIEEKFKLDIPVFIIEASKLKELLENQPEWWGTANKEIYDNIIFIIPPTTYEEVYKALGKPKQELEKIKEYTEYMSDIITAVKGQAVTLSETENVSFDLDELVKRVNILMKHELKSAVVYLNIHMNVDSKTTIHGDVNSLVQVINNMISNAIQAYNGKEGENIDLILEKQNNNLIISVKDYGSGLPEKVKNKLFKEMITTKGKNGTGLGLYMSYSTIKAHFNGDITFESEANKGTTFNITLPL